MPPVSRWLLGVILSLILVGFVSSTPIRHLIQVVPCIVSLILISRSYRWASYSALPLFVFWLGIMILIWLFLLGFARIITGRFTPVEIGLTLTIGLSCLGGAWMVIRTSPPVAALTRLAAFSTFMFFQIGALWLSLQPFFARR